HRISQRRHYDSIAFLERTQIQGGGRQEQTIQVQSPNDSIPDQTDIAQAPGFRDAAGKQYGVQGTCKSADDAHARRSHVTADEHRNLAYIVKRHKDFGRYVGPSYRRLQGGTELSKRASGGHDRVYIRQHNASVAVDRLPIRRILLSAQFKSQFVADAENVGILNSAGLHNRDRSRNAQ